MKINLKSALSTLGLTACLLQAGPGSAAVIYENGTLNDFCCGNNPFAYQLVADDFILSSGGTIGSITYNAFTTGATVPVTNVHVEIFADNAGSLGSQLFSGNFSVAQQQVTGNFYGYYDLTDYTVNVPFWNLAAGHYWLGLQVDPTQWDMHWSIPNSGTGYTGTDGWDHYFRLDSSQVGAVPEPETYAMLLAGLGLLGFAARRRKLKAAAAA